MHILLETLKTNDQNPRNIDDKNFKSLLNKILRNPDGLDANKIVYKDGLVIAGNQRFRALQTLGDRVEVKDSYFKDVTSWTSEQVSEYLIISNVSDGKWDYDELANGWDIEDLRAWGVDVPNDFSDGVTEQPVVEPTELKAIVVIAYNDIEDLDMITDLYNLEAIDITKEIKLDVNKQRKAYVFKK